VQVVGAALDLNNDMRYHELMTEASKRILPVTPANIAAAKQFVFAKWKERAKERGHDEPVDLSSACKFASLFAAEVFGGQVRGNFFHQWVELPDGQHLDLNAEAEDVATMLRGKIPADMQAYAELSRKRLPSPLYAHDARHMRTRDNRDSMASIEPRVRAWVAEFMRMKWNEIICEAITPSVAPRLWIGADGVSFDCRKDDMSHAEMVLHHPERFGLKPSDVHNVTDEDGEFRYDFLIALAEMRGWVRTSTDGAQTNSMAISANGIVSLHRACRWLAAHNLLRAQLDIEIEQLVGTTLQSRYAHLDTADVETFLQTRRLPRFQHTASRSV
jgi:hypothetical protein